MRGLIAVVACCGVVSWAARTFWESQNPAIAAARGLRSPNPSVRVGATRELSTSGAADADVAAPALAAALADPEVAVRIAAAESLGAMISDLVRTGSAGEPIRAGVEGLIGSLKDRETAVRIAATNALATIAAAKGAAGVIELQAVIVALVASLGDADDEVRLAALLALTGCGPLASSDPPAALVAALQDRSARNRAAAITALARFPRSLDPWLALLLRLVEHDPEVRQASQSAFLRDRPPAFSADSIPALAAALGSRSRIVRSYAARALYPHASDPRAAVAIPALLAVLREPIDPELTRQSEPGRPRRLEGLGSLRPGRVSAGPARARHEVGRRGHRGADRSRPIRPRLPAGVGGPCPGRVRPGRRVGRPRARAGVAGRPGQEGRRPLFLRISGRLALGRIAPRTKSADEALAALIEALDSRSEVRLATRIAAIEALPPFGATDARVTPLLRAWQKNPDLHLKRAADKAVTVLDGGGAGKPAGDRKPAQN